MAAYTDGGRTNQLSHSEMEALVQRFMPELFITEFDRMKSLCRRPGRAPDYPSFAQSPPCEKLDEASCKALNDFVAGILLSSLPA